MRKKLDDYGRIQKSFLMIAGAFSLFFMVLVVLSFVDIFTGNSSPGATGQLVIEENISTDGGIITVNDDSDISGLTLEIVEDSYVSDIDVSISVLDISNVDFVEDFNPITPLIVIDNLHEFSAEPMILSVPIDIDTETEFAMAFFYDTDSKELEAIPTVSLSDTEITVATSHFSSLVISTITLEKLIRIGLDVEGADSGFRPGVDDWNFPNNGSALESEGHCAGQSVTAAYYYVTRKKALMEENLWNRFDNNGEDTKTPDFWYDDAHAYHYASIIQDKMNFRTADFDTFYKFSKDNDSNVYYSFLYAIHITKNPQLIAIYSKDLAGNFTGGHAMLVYKVKGSRLYIADPNYPGQTDRYIDYNAFDVLTDYSSGANAIDIATSGAIAYSDFIYVGLSAFIDFKTLEEDYISMTKGTLRDGFLMGLSFEYMTVYNDDVTKIEYAYYNNTPFTIAADYNEKVGDSLINKVLLRGNSYDTNVYVSIYRGTDLIATRIPESSITEFSLEILFEEGLNDIGFLLEIKRGSEYLYVTFQRIEFTYLGEILDPEEEVLGVWNYDFPETQNPLDYSFIEFFANGTYHREMYFEEGWFSGFVIEEDGTYVVRDRGDGTYDVVLYYDGGNGTYIFSENFTRITHTGAAASTFIKEKE